MRLYSVAPDPRRRRDPQLRCSRRSASTCRSASRRSPMAIAFAYVWLPFMILPVYAALERVPGSLIEASRDLGARGFGTFRTVVLPLAFPGVVAGLDLHVLAHARRLHHAVDRGRRQPPADRHRSSTATSASPTTPRSRPPSRRCRSRSWPSTSLAAQAPRRIRAPLADGIPRHQLAARASGRCSSSLFLYVPLAIIVLYAFNRSNVQTLADHGLLHALVQRRLERPGGARRVRAVAEGRVRRDGRRARARHGGRVRRRALPLLRPSTRSRSCVVIPIALPGIDHGHRPAIVLRHRRDRRSRSGRS